MYYNRDSMKRKIPNAMKAARRVSINVRYKDFLVFLW